MCITQEKPNQGLKRKTKKKEINGPNPCKIIVFEQVIVLSGTIIVLL
jgi:hypothetical protein